MAPAEHLIEIRVDRLAQLFHTLDPFPFREKDLDQDAEEYIVSWARELPDRRPVRIAVHLPEGDAFDANSKELNEAFHRYFAGRAVAVPAGCARPAWSGATCRRRWPRPLPCPFSD